MKRTVSRIMLIVLLSAMLRLVFNIQPVKTEPTTITVPDDYETIQEAINGANDGVTIHVRKGTYYEHVIVNKSLSLTGAEGNTAIIDGSFTGSVMNITADHVNVTGLTIQNSGHEWLDTGICLFNSSNCNVAKNIITNNRYGIGLYNSSSNDFVGNDVCLNRINGIVLFWSSNNNTFAGNTVSNNENGILLWHLVNETGNNTVIHNNFINNSDQASIFLDTLINITSTSQDQVQLGIEQIGYVNVWDDGYPSGGNYWSDHNPLDENKDKIGDTPYIMDENNTDTYPLIYPFECYKHTYVYSPDLDKDGIVNIIDVSKVAGAFGSVPGDSNWSAFTDMDLNEVVNIVDVSKVAKEFGKEWQDKIRCPYCSFVFDETLEYCPNCGAPTHSM